MRAVRSGPWGAPRATLASRHTLIAASISWGCMLRTFIGRSYAPWNWPDTGRICLGPGPCWPGGGRGLCATMCAMTLRLRSTVAFVLALLVVVPNAGAAPYPPTFALHPAFTSASIGANGSILVNLEEEYEKSTARHSTASRYLADGQLDQSFEPVRPGGMEVAEVIDSKGRTLRRSARGGIERLNPDGSVETSFAPPVRDSPGSWSDEFRIEAILPLASGKVAVAGQVLRQIGQSRRYEVRVALYEESGLIDSAFGTEGIVRLAEEIGVEGEEFVGLTPGPDEDVLVSFNQKDWARGAPTSMVGSGSRVVALNLKGGLDPGFASGGVFGSPDPIAAVEGMPDGGLFLAGTRWGAALSRSGQAHHSDVYLERLTPLGAPDPAFGERQGRTTVDFGGIDVLHTLLLRPDGSTLVGGGTTSLSPRCPLYESTFCTETPVLAAFTASGGLDRGFGRRGVLRLGPLAYKFALFSRFRPVESLGVLFLRELPDGTVLAGGGTEVGAFLAEVGDDGRLESGFGDGGTVTRTNPRPSTTELRSMALDRRGGIVVSGYTDAGVSQGSGAVFRFRADGAVDRGFAGGQGFVRVPEPPISPEPAQAPAGISLDAHGRALALGAEFPSERATVTRIGTNGRPDPRFGIDGIALLPRYVPMEMGARKVRLRLNLLAKLATALPEGGSLVYARAGHNHGARLYPALIRLTSRGRLDRSFGRRGVAVIVGGVGGNFDPSVMLALSGGKILLGGAVRSPCGSAYPGRSAALMRLRSDGSLDPSFGHGGLTTVPSCRWGRTFTSMALGPKGEIITVGGTWRKWRKTGPDRCSAEDLPVIDRFSARGRLDRGFGRRAIRTLPSPGGGNLSMAERVILWRDQILVSGPGVSGAFVYSRNGRFERKLIPAGRRKPVAGYTLGVAVQDGKPVVVTTTQAKRKLTVQPLMSAAAPEKRRAG